MLAGERSVRKDRLGQIFTPGDRQLLLLSLVIQLVVGLFFGHVYDQRIFMATGYLTATGQDPYIAQDLTRIFHNPLFQGMTSIGYPPPWALVLGFIYLLTFAWLPNLLVYNLAIKLPIIVANLALAYLVRHILVKRGASDTAARGAWIFLLFNPLLLYTTTAWGQFDSLVALLVLAALLLLDGERPVMASILLAAAIAFKPTPAPLVLVLVIHLWGAPWKRLIISMLAFGLTLAALCVVPFLVFHWDASPILHGWNAQFSVSGGMSLTTLYELFQDTYLLPGSWWLLGFAWIPAVLVAAWLIRRVKDGLVGLLSQSLVLILVFYLTRTWLSEQNLVLILPLVLILVSLGELPKITLVATWVLPLVFTVFNTSPAQLLFPILPDVMTRLLQWADIYRSARLAARMLVVLPWQAAGWWMVVHVLKTDKLAVI